MSWLRKRKIVHLPGTKLSPETVLARTLEKVPEGIQSVYIGIEMTDGSFVADWSSMKVSSLNVHARVANRTAERVTFGDDPYDIIGKDRA